MPRHKKRGKPKKRMKTRLVLCIIMSLAIFIAAAFLSLVDKRLLPTVIKMEEYRISTRLSEAINASLTIFTDEDGSPLVSSDFYHVELDLNGKVSSLSANTILINEVCVNLSRFLNNYLSDSPDDIIEVPIGALLGISWLANIGPSYRISVMPVGMSDVSYQTSFDAVGINQINFQVWIKVETQMQVVNPLQSRELSVSRDIPLVNTVFSGEIPMMYVNPQGDGAK